MPEVLWCSQLKISMPDNLVNVKYNVGCVVSLSGQEYGSLPDCAYASV